MPAPIAVGDKITAWARRIKSTTRRDATEKSHKLVRGVVTAVREHVFAWKPLAGQRVEVKQLCDGTDKEGRFWMRGHSPENIAMLDSIQRLSK